jgi:S1-C subfamily serine protease
MAPNEHGASPAAAGEPEIPPAAEAGTGTAGQTGAAVAAAEASGTLLATFSDQLARAVELVSESVVRVEARRRQPASGVVWTAAEGSALVVMADHALERDEDITLGLPDGRTAAAAVVGRDPGTDLALLRAQAGGLKPIERGPAPKIGQLALVVARPGHAPAASIGVVSALGGPAQTWRGGRLEGVIWTDAALYPGFSGAPLVDAAGRMVGLVTSQFGRGAGLAVSLETVGRVVGTLVSHGRIKHGFLGIQSQRVELSEALRSRTGVAQESGLLIVGVERGGPAERGGVLIGDVLVALDGHTVQRTDDLLGLLGGERIGQPATLRVIRGGELREVQVIVGERE